jgi:hypothetical protein
VGLFGITLNANRFFIERQFSEWRFRLIQDSTGDQYIGTMSAADHWQNSHSHRANVEDFTLLQGTLVIVYQDPKNQSLLRVQSFTKTGDTYVEVTFTYDTTTRRASDLHIARSTNAPNIFTEVDLAHNGFLSADAVIGTTKVVVRESKPDAPPDWIPEKSLDTALNARSEQSDTSPQHEAILTIIHASL